MNLDELAIEYYHNSLALAQKALIAGLTVASVAYLVAITGEGKPSYTLPLVEIEITSLSYFSISLIILFVACGVVCSFGVHKALDNWKLVSEKDLALRLLQVPSIFMLGTAIDSLLYGFIFMVGASLSEAAFGLSGWHTFVFGSILATPYFIAFSRSSDLRRLSKE